MIDTTGLPSPADAPPPGACVRLERPEPGLARIVLDPPHRALAVLDLPLLRDLDLALDEVERDASLLGLVITGRAPTSFAAGADLDALAGLRDRALVARVVDIGQRIFERIARLSARSPALRTVAAVGGPVPGGAYELALACSCIVAANADATRIGLPEVQLGILPAWGGSTRLPRRIGVPAALEAILAGRLYAARDALRRGMVDRLAFPEDLARIADAIAAGRLECRRKERPLSGLLVDRGPLAARIVASQARKRVLAQTRGRYPAPLAALEIVARAPRVTTERSLADEARAASELAVGDVSKNLIAIFRLSEAAKKLKSLPAGGSAERPARAGVLGAGVMGRGIASLLAERGVATRLFDVAPAALDAALLEHRAAVAEKRRKRRLEPHEANAAVDRLDATRELAGFARAGIVIEAVAERLEVKRAVFAQLARQAATDAILATNTSSLSVAEIAAGLPHEERFVGLHFFNPVRKMPLVEIVRGRSTSDEVVARTAALALSLGKTPVVVADVAGFLVNRLLGPYLDEALRLFEGGVEPERIDRAARDFGMPMGPLALLDEVGFDIAAHAASSLHAAYGPRMTPSGVVSAMLAAGHGGKKSGRGFYVHGGDAKDGPPQLAGGLERFRPAGAPRAAVASDEELAERMLLAMVAEARRALAEGVVASPRDVDLATVFGIGFPPFRGGLMRWAESLGEERVADRLEALRSAEDVAAREGGRERFELEATVAA